MVEFTNQTNYTYILNNDTISNSSTRATQLIAKHKFSFSFKDFVILLIDIFMVTGPSIGYFLQSLKFKRTRSSKGFSKSICLIIYNSQILRVFFWIGKPFKITLLYQSILIICFQIYLIHLWVKFHDTEPNKDPKNITDQNQIQEFNIYEKKDIIEYLIDWSDTISPNKFWNWSNEIEYYKFMSLSVLILLVISGVVGIHNVFLTNIYGTISVISEASTLIPQIIVSCRTKNASNLSFSMVLLWFIGDSCKFVHNINYHTPIQMIISGGLQIFLDFFVLMQIYCYKGRNKLKEKDSNESKFQFGSTVKSRQVQQINQFMNKLEERFEGDIGSKSDEGNNDSKHKVDVLESQENSDKAEVLDKSKDTHIKYASDEDVNNFHHQLHEEENVENEIGNDKDNENGNRNTVTESNLNNEDGENEVKIDEN
jgi:uncharacterized protein with PQ loop repeat